MSALAKVFVVLNLLLSLLFFGTSATLFLTRQDLGARIAKTEADHVSLKKQLDRRIQQQKETIVSQHAAVTALRASESDLSAQVRAERTNITQQTTRADRAEAERSKMVTLQEQTRADLAARESRIQALEGTLSTERSRADEAAQLAEAANTERNRMKRDLEQSVADGRALREQVSGLESKLEEAELKLAVVIEKHGPDAVRASVAPPLDARVVAVDAELGAIVLNVGRDQDVQEGFEFTVYRGERFIGTVRVTTLFRDMAGAKIVFENEGMSIQTGDGATTRIGANS